MSTETQRKRHSPAGPGYTIRTFASLPEVRSTPAMIRGAVRRGEIKAILFNGVQRIPPSEKQKYLEIWGEPSRGEAAE